MEKRSGIIGIGTKIRGSFERVRQFGDSRTMRTWIDLATDSQRRVVSKITPAILKKFAFPVRRLPGIPTDLVPAVTLSF
jgi:hypothetical protein